MTTATQQSVSHATTTERVLRWLGGWGRLGSDFLVFALVVAAVVAAAIFLNDTSKVLLLKLLVVFYFSLLPAVLYLQFNSRRKQMVWREFVVNLFELDLDEPARLPEPPRDSEYWPHWREARDRAWEAQKRHGESHSDFDDRCADANLYWQKFRDVFGEIPPPEQAEKLRFLRSGHKLQVVVATVLITIGWVFVAQPESVFRRSLVPSDFVLTHLPEIPQRSFAFAFLGAYFYILQMLVRRYFQGDLKPTAYLNATMRITVVILLVWVIDAILAETGASQATRSAAAFVVGVFPTTGWRFLQLSVRNVFGVVVDTLEPNHKLGDIDGLSIWYESRLLEVGVEDQEHLATTDIGELMLNTRIPVDRLVDWIDQSFLYLRIEDEAKRKQLRSYGVRNATDLIDLMAANGKAYEGILDAPGEPSRMRALVATLNRERNFAHVTAWKENTDPRRGKEPAPA